MCGLCGNFNGNSTDDKQKPGKLFEDTINNAGGSIAAPKVFLVFLTRPSSLSLFAKYLACTIYGFNHTKLFTNLAVMIAGPGSA